MAKPCPTLPHEVWVNILNQINDKKHLATCRLVCKRWNLVAEKAMFNQELEITPRESYVAKLHYHLTRNPAMIPFIRKVHLVDDYTTGLKPSLLYRELLTLVMNPNLETVLGHFQPKEIESLFYHVILDSADKFKQLKAIPTNSQNDLCLNSYLALKGSLEYMYLSMSTPRAQVVLDQLNEFTSLQYLDLTNRSFYNIEKLDSILDKLQCAIRLELWTDFTEEDYTSKSSSRMNAWLAHHVTKDERMESLNNVSNWSKVHWCNLVEYLVYKYPNLRFSRFHKLTVDGDIERILQATKHIPFFILAENECYDPEHLWTLGYMMKSQSNVIKIEYAGHLDDDDGQCQIEEVWRQDSTATSEFTIKLRSEAPHTYIKQLLSSVNSGTSIITKAKVDLVHWRDQDISQGLLTFYDILRLAPTVQDLEFINDIVRYQELGAGDLLLNGLKSLEIAGAKIDHRVITQLGDVAPHLDRLIISSSIVVGREEKFAIILPQSTLSSLVFQTKCFDWDRGDEDFEYPPVLRELSVVEKKMDIKEIMYLCIKMELLPTQYYVLKANSQVITMISVEEFSLHGAPSTTVYIECKSLSLLLFKLDNLVVTLQFENGVLKSPFKRSRDLTLGSISDNVDKITIA